MGGIAGEMWDTLSSYEEAPRRTTQERQRWVYTMGTESSSSKDDALRQVPFASGQENFEAKFGSPKTTHARKVGGAGKM